MEDLKKNKCRKCTKVFCCISCREKHEVNFHNIDLSCEICNFGKIYPKKINEKLSQHIKEIHLPLHCINCKKRFENISKLNTEPKCSGINAKCEVYPETPSSYPSSSNILTPFQKSIIMASNTFYSVTNSLAAPITSTPMQNVENENILENIATDLTPLDKEKEGNISQITPINSDAKTMEELKRKVTFCDTPNYETVKKKADVFSKETKFCMVSENKHTTEKVKNNFSTCNNNETELNNAEIITSTDNVPSELNILTKELLIVSDLISSKIENDTVWVSALNRSNFEELLNETDKSVKEKYFKDFLQVNDIENKTDKPEKFFTPSTKNSTSSKKKIVENKTSNIPNFYNANEIEDKNLTVDESIHENLKNSDTAPPKNLKSIEQREPLSEICSMILGKSWNNVNIRQCNSSTSLNYQELIEESVKINYKKTLMNIGSTSTCTFNTEENFKFNKCVEEKITLKKSNIKSSNKSYCLEKSEKSEIVEEKSIVASTKNGNLHVNADKGSMWSSVTNLVKSVFQSFSSQDSLSVENEKLTLKRSYSNEDTSLGDEPCLKRMKLSDIRCRPTIRNLRPVYRLNSFTKPKETADKATQTDRSFIVNFD